MLLEELIRVCNRLAPEALAEEWDNVGLQAGNPGREVWALLLCLETTADTVAEARRLGVDCIVSHHPLLFRPLRSLREDRAEGRLLAGLARAGIAFYAMHTNLDNANPGTSDALAAALGIVGLQPLAPLTRPVGEPMLKLAVFVPATHAEALRAALGNAGAGHIGNYSHCSFSASGVGAFLPLAGANPAIGAVGVPERVPEEKVEVLVPRRILPQVLTAMLAVHPYEEVAYDLYPLETPPTGAGLGRIGRWETPGTLAEFAARVRAALPISYLRLVGDPERRIERVALCGGAGADLMDVAADLGADVLVTGDVKHHEALHALDRNLAVLDAGHYATERPVLDQLANALRDALPETIHVYVSALNTDPFSPPC